MAWILRATIVPKRGEKSGSEGNVPELVGAGGRSNRRWNITLNSDGLKRQSPGIAPSSLSIRAKKSCTIGLNSVAGESGQKPTNKRCRRPGRLAARTAWIRSSALRSIDWSRPRSLGTPERRAHPVIKAKERDVDAAAILREHAGGIEQLLEDLIVRRELDRGPQSLAPASRSPWTP